MKNIIKIFKDDLKDIFSNSALIIVVIGLAILPSLYAWFNIKASWDPYGNTANIPVALVNSDKGATLFDKDLDIGDTLIKKLKTNKSLGWKIVSKDEALKGVENGTYYASIEIPENFSEDLVSVLTKDIKKAQIIYTVNEKINAIAPKITDKGASSIQLKISQTVVNTASTVVFEILNELGISLEKNLPTLTRLENSLIDIQGKFGEINSILDTVGEASNQIKEISNLLQDDMPLIETTLENSKGLSKDVGDFLENTKVTMNDIAPIIKGDLEIMNGVSLSIESGIENIINAINQNQGNILELITNVDTKVENVLLISTKLEEFLVKLDSILPGTSIQNTINSIRNINDKLEVVKNTIESVKKQINNGETPSLDKLNDVLTVVKDVRGIINNILDNYQTSIVDPLNNIFDKGIVVSNNVIDVIQKAEKKLPKISNILDTAIDFSGDADKAIDYIKDKMPEAKAVLDKLVESLAVVNDSKEMSDLISFLQNDVVEQANFLQEPVEITSNVLYPMPNYGAAMTPFYTVLSLWVGILILTSLLTTELEGEYKAYEVYFGRGLIFVTISLLQALIVSVGDIYLLGVDVKNKILFILLSLLISLVFTFIVYSLVSVFGNLGKAVGVILLVIQVAGSGGTFPIQVTPEFFQIVNPFLPFTYGIGALREAVAGVYQANLNRDIYMLIIFLILSIILNVILKKPINNILFKFMDKLEHSRLTEH